jgi:hypothetical protein
MNVKVWILDKAMCNLKPYLNLRPIPYEKGLRIWIQLFCFKDACLKQNMSYGTSYSLHNYYKVGVWKWNSNLNLSPIKNLESINTSLDLDEKKIEFWLFSS